MNRYTYSIYWPALKADDVLELAGRFYTSKALTKKDAHTIQCVSGSVSYIPIPPGTGPSLAGLLTVDLPLTVTVGEEFNIVVRRLRWRLQSREKAQARQSINWRYVVGAFQIRVPVSTGPALLPAEESLLALFKWKIESIPVNNRWYPVLVRYVEQVSGRVSGFGGNPGQIKPSQGGFPGLRGHHHPERLEWTGKVANLAYDRFGDFEGFVLVTQTGHEHRFHGREPEIERVVRYAWDERAVISVFAEKHREEWPVSIILRRVPRN